MDGVGEVLMVQTLPPKNGKPGVRVPRPNFNTQAAFRLYLEQQQYDRISRHREHISKQNYGDYVELLNLWSVSCTAGTWAWNTQASLQALNTPDHIVELLFLSATQLADQQGLLREMLKPVVRDHYEDCINVIKKLVGPTPTTAPAPKEEAGASPSPSPKSVPSLSASPST